MIRKVEGKGRFVFAGGVQEGGGAGNIEGVGVAVGAELVEKLQQVPQNKCNAENHLL